MEGELSPIQTLMACVDMPLPDSDNHGFPDQNDYYPFDPPATDGRPSSRYGVNFAWHSSTLVTSVPAS